MKFTLQGQVILVEGKGDKEFFLGLLEKLGKHGVKPAPPSESSTLGNGVDNVIKYIPQLIAAIQADEVTRAAIVVDADHANSNGGFAARRHQIAEKLTGSGFVNLQTDGMASGEIFSHPDYPAVIGLFILPNHQDDGMLEDLLKEMVINHPYQKLMQHARTTVAELDPMLFNAKLHGAKAEVNTFLAWQEKPPASMRGAVENQIFDIDAPECAKLVAWLERIFV